MRPLLLDLYCGQGGAAMGYYQAGFDVIGVDKVPQPRYPFDFCAGDALQILRDLLTGKTSPVLGYSLAEIDAIHASPPCQAHSTITPDKSKHVDLIPPTRDLLNYTGLPYLIENVEGAKRVLINPTRFCGSAFGLKVRRHRYFETNFPIKAVGLVCRHAAQGTPIGVYGDHPELSAHRRPSGTSRGVRATTLEEAQNAMEMPWANWHGCTQAVPPAYTEYIGRQLRSSLALQEAL